MSLDNYAPGHLNLVISRLKYMMYVLVLDIIFVYWFAEMRPEICHAIVCLALGTFRGLRFTAEEPLTDGNIPV